MINIKKYGQHSEYIADANTQQSPNVSVCIAQNEVHYDKDKYKYMYLTFNALSAGTFSYNKDYSYSLDSGKTWVSLSADNSTPTVAAGGNIMLKAAPNDNACGAFSSTNQFMALGNPLSMLYGDNFVNGQLTEGCFEELFISCTGLTSAKFLSLSSPILANSCYASMFSDCTSLVDAPELPATMLAQSCYDSMFASCTSLTKAPELPATTLVYDCYVGMFQGCTSLTKAPELPATTLANNCYNSMFRGCSSLVNAPDLPATTLAISCYGGMFYGCTSLVNAPELPATTLADYCYRTMFYGCTSLVNAPELPATTLADYCYNEMFRGCTSLVNAPFLSAKTPATDCYKGMFKGCSSLNHISVMLNDTLDDNALSQWVSGVSQTGTFVMASDAEGTFSQGTSGIPTGWNVEVRDCRRLVMYLEDLAHGDNPRDLDFYADEWSYASAQEYVNAMVANPKYFTMKTYTLLSYGFEFGGKKRYIWGYNERVGGGAETVQYVITDTCNYHELIRKSIGYNIENSYNPCISVLSSDLNEYHSSYGGVNYLITVRYE